MNRSLSFRLLPFLQGTAQNRGLIFGVIILFALLAFEIFNYSSTLFALTDILGNLAFGPLRWASILAFAFCAIDFAGIARIFTPEQGSNEPAEVWYLFAAWFLAAAFNASLTWWGVSVAILQHNALGGVLVGASAMTKIVPVFVAAMVLLIRVLLGLEPGDHDLTSTPYVPHAIGSLGLSGVPGRWGRADTPTHPSHMSS